MAGMAQVTIVGNLGADPELKFSTDGKGTCKLRLAVTDSRKGKDGAWQDHTQWFGVSVFGRQAEQCAQYLAKGRQVLVMGRLEAREYQGKDGTTKTALDVAADKVQFLGTRDKDADRPQTAAASPTPSPKPSATPMQQPEDEELPF